MKKFKTILNYLLQALAGASFIAMVALTCWQVIARYLLKNPSTWSEELVSYLFAWASLFGASLVTAERGHMNIPILIDRLKPGAQKGFHVFSEVVTFIFSAVILVYGGVQITQLAMGQMTSSLGVAVGVFYIALPFCGVVNILYTICNIIEIIKEPKKEEA